MSALQKIISKYFFKLRIIYTLKVVKDHQMIKSNFMLILMLCLFTTSHAQVNNKRNNISIKSSDEAKPSISIKATPTEPVNVTNRTTPAYSEWISINESEFIKIRYRVYHKINWNKDVIEVEINNLNVEMNCSFQLSMSSCSDMFNEKSKWIFIQFNGVGKRHGYFDVQENCNKGVWYNVRSFVKY